MVLEHQLLNTPQISRPDSMVACETDNGLQPKLGFAIVRPHMDVRRPYSLIGIKMEPVRPDSQDRGHRASVWFAISDWAPCRRQQHTTRPVSHCGISSGLKNALFVVLAKPDVKRFGVPLIPRLGRVPISLWRCHR